MTYFRHNEIFRIPPSTSTDVYVCGAIDLCYRSCGHGFETCHNTAIIRYALLDNQPKSFVFTFVVVGLFM